MTKIIITEHKRDKLVDKLECAKECLEKAIHCMSALNDEYEDTDDREDTEDDEWDDEYEIKRRRGSRGIPERKHHKRF